MDRVTKTRNNEIIKGRPGIGKSCSVSPENLIKILEKSK